MDAPKQYSEVMERVWADYDPEAQNSMERFLNAIVGKSGKSVNTLKVLADKQAKELLPMAGGAGEGVTEIAVDGLLHALRNALHTT